MQLDGSADALIATFLDVGQGDATVVVLPSGDSAIVVDCPLGADSHVLDYLDRMGVRLLELVVMTHSDLDHAGGIPDLVTRFLDNYSGAVGCLAFLDDRTELNEHPVYRSHMLSMVDFVLHRGIKHRLPVAGTTLTFGDVTVTVLHPESIDHIRQQTQLRTTQQAAKMRNDASVVLRLDYQGRRLLLGADVRGPGWQWMIDRQVDIKADVFKIPHHGAWYSDGLPLHHLLDMVDPQYAIVSVGTTNRNHHPADNTLSLLRARGTPFRFVCTQVTNKCHPNVAAMADIARHVLVPSSRGGYSYVPRHRTSCPCAGTVTVSLSAAGVSMSPTVDEHNRVIDLFDHPQCRARPQEQEHQPESSFG